MAVPILEIANVAIGSQTDPIRHPVPSLDRAVEHIYVTDLIEPRHRHDRRLKWPQLKVSSSDRASIVTSHGLPDRRVAVDDEAMFLGLYVETELVADGVQSSIAKEDILQVPQTQRPPGWISDVTALLLSRLFNLG